MFKRGNSRFAAAAAALLLGFAAAAAASPAPAADPPATGFAATVAAAKTAMLGDPVRALALGRTAEAEAAARPPGRDRDMAVATARWIEGEGAYRANDIADARPLTESALAMVQRSAPGSALNADLLLSRARLRREGGQPQEALADLQDAYNLFGRLRDARGQAKALQSIGSIYLDAQDYERVLYYYRSAEDLYPNDPSLAIPASNNIANALLLMGNKREAEIEYGRSLRLARKINSQLLVARILANIGDLAIRDHDYERAEIIIAEGLKLTSHPAAASWRPMLLGTRASLNFAEGQLDSARNDLAAAFALTSKTQTDQTFSPLHLTAYRVYKALGDTMLALQHLETYQRMEDQARALAASTNAALMTAKFDFANQNVRIATLKAGQLSRDIALTRLRARQATIMFSALLGAMLAVVVTLFFYLRAVRRSRAEIMAANARLEQTNVELGEALAAKSQFLATTSHEIRTPLNGILGMTQVMLADRALGTTTRDRVALVDAAGRAMRTLVDDILDFAKMDSGAVRLDVAPVRLTAMLPELVSLWRAQAEAKGIDLALTMEGVEAPLVTDAARLRQVVFNLLSNAVKFTAAGAITVDVRSDADAAGTWVLIAVRDTGVGIPPTAFETIFEPFRQLDTSTTRQFGGTGLGLAISRHLVRVLGGDLTVASSPGHGATFTVRLPYRPAAGAAAPSELAAAPLLIASASPIRRSFLRTALEPEFGHAALCEPEALAGFVAGRSVGVVLLDADDDGTLPDFLAQLDAMGSATAVVVLVPEALAGSEAEWRTRAVARVIVKPVRVEAAAAALRAVAAGGKDADAATRPVVLSSDLP